MQNIKISCRVRPYEIEEACSSRQSLEQASAATQARALDRILAAISAVCEESRGKLNRNLIKRT